MGGNTGRFALKCVEYNSDVNVTIMDLPQQLELMHNAISGKTGAERIHGHGANLLDDSVPKMWAGSIYRWLGIQYPKFFKMDTLCKFGFLASELIMKQLTLSPEEPKKDWAMLCLNACSSIDTDRHYQTTIQNADNYYPSPSVFVYTLANIVTGEIAIRHKLMGESSTYIFDTLNPDTLCALVNNAIGENRANNALCGWINYDGGVCDVMMFAVSAQKSGDFGKEWTAENIKQCMMKLTWRNFYI